MATCADPYSTEWRTFTTGERVQSDFFPQQLILRLAARCTTYHTGYRYGKTATYMTPGKVAYKFPDHAPCLIVQQQQGLFKAAILYCISGQSGPGPPLGWKPRRTPEVRGRSYFNQIS